MDNNQIAIREALRILGGRYSSNFYDRWLIIMGLLHLHNQVCAAHKERPFPPDLDLIYNTAHNLMKTEHALNWD